MESPTFINDYLDSYLDEDHEVLRLDSYYYAYNHHFSTFSDFLNWVLSKGKDIIDSDKGYARLFLSKNSDTTLTLFDTTGIYDKFNYSLQGNNYQSNRWTNQVKDFFSSTLQREFDRISLLKVKQRFVEELCLAIESDYRLTLLDSDSESLNEFSSLEEINDAYKKEFFKSLKKSYLKVNSLVSTLGRILSKLCIKKDLRRIIRCTVCKIISHLGSDDDEISFEYTI